MSEREVCETCGSDDRAVRRHRHPAPFNAWLPPHDEDGTWDKNKEICHASFHDTPHTVTVERHGDELILPPTTAEEVLGQFGCYPADQPDNLRLCGCVSCRAQLELTRLRAIENVAVCPRCRGRSARLMLNRQECDHPIHKLLAAK